MTTNVNRFADVLFQAVNGVSRASVGQGRPPVAFVNAFSQSLDLWDDSLPLVIIDASASSVSQTLDGGTQRDDYAFDISIYAQTPDEVAEVISLVEQYLNRNARTWNEVEGTRTDEANYEYFYTASIQPSAFQPATARSTGGGGAGGVPPDGSVGFDQLAQAVKDAIGASFVAVQPDGISAVFVTQGGDTADDNRALGKSVVLYALGGDVGAITKVNNSLHILQRSRDGVETTQTISLPSGSGNSSHTDLQIEHLAAGEITQALLGISYDPGTQAFGGRRHTTANWPLLPADLAVNAVVDRLTADLSNAGKLSALQTLLAVWAKLKTLSALPATTGYNIGELINVNGEIYELVAASDEANVLTGTAGHSGNYVGANTTGDGVAYGSLSGGLKGTVAWAPTAENIPLARYRFPLASYSAAVHTLYVRAEAGGEYADFVVTRNSDLDEALDDGINVYGYDAPTTGERMASPTGSQFRHTVWTNQDFATGPVVMHTAARWERWLPRQTGLLHIPSAADVKAIAADEADKRFTDAEKSKLEGVSDDAIDGSQAEALMRPSGRASSTLPVAKQDALTVLSTPNTPQGQLLTALSLVFGNGAVGEDSYALQSISSNKVKQDFLSGFLNNLSESEKPNVRAAMGPYVRNGGPTFPTALRDGDRFTLNAALTRNGTSLMTVGGDANSLGWYQAIGSIIRPPTDIVGILAYPQTSNVQSLRGRLAVIRHADETRTIQTIKLRRLGATEDEDDAVRTIALRASAALNHFFESTANTYGDLFTSGEKWRIIDIILSDGTDAIPAESYEIGDYVYSRANDQWEFVSGHPYAQLDARYVNENGTDRLNDAQLGRRYLTQAAYDALTTAQKNDGTEYNIVPA